MKNVSIYGNFFAGKRREGMTDYGNGENGKFPKTWTVLSEEKALAGTSSRRGVPASRTRRTVSRPAHGPPTECSGRIMPGEPSLSSFQSAGWHIWICLMRKKGI